MLQKVSEGIRRCQKVSEGVRMCQKTSEGVGRRQKVSEGVRRHQKHIEGCCVGVGGEEYKQPAKFGGWVGVDSARCSGQCGRSFC